MPPVKAIKLAILLCGLVGLVSVFTPFDGMSLFEATRHGQIADSIIVVAGFAVPAVLAALALCRPPMAQWQAVASLAALVVLAVKTRLWEFALEVLHLPHVLQLFVIADIAGVVACVLALAPQLRDAE